MMWKKGIAILIAIVMTVSFVSVASASGGSDSRFNDTDNTKATGYYIGEELSLVVLGNGNLYTLISEESDMSLISFSLLSSGSDFIIICDDGQRYALQAQDKDRTTDGGRYYALYTNYLGNTEETDYKEGRQVLFGKDVFDNDYDVVVRYPLSRFFGVEDEYAERFEGAGFDTPEEALSAYAQALKDRDVNTMIAAFAVETFVDRYDLQARIGDASYLDNYSFDRQAYIGGEMQRQLNIYNRIGTITADFIQLQYASITAELAFRGGISLRGKDFEESIIEYFTIDEIPYFKSLTIGRILDYEQVCQKVEEILGDVTDSYDTQMWINRYQNIYDTDDYTILAQEISVDGRDGFIVAELGLYNGKWYLLMMRCTAIASGLYDLNSGGIIWVEDLEEKAAEKRAAEEAKAAEEKKAAEEAEAARDAVEAVEDAAVLVEDVRDAVEDIVEEAVEAVEVAVDAEAAVEEAVDVAEAVEAVEEAVDAVEDAVTAD